LVSQDHEAVNPNLTIEPTNSYQWVTQNYKLEKHVQGVHIYIHYELPPVNPGGKPAKST